MVVYATRFSLDEPGVEELPSVDVDGAKIYFTRWYPRSTVEVVVTMVVDEEAGSEAKVHPTTSQDDD